MARSDIHIPSTDADIELFRLAAEHAPVHIIFTDTDGFIQYANPAAEKITGYTRKEMIGKRPSLWGGHMPKEFYQNMWRTIKEKKQVFRGEIKNRRKDGSVYLADATISPVIEGKTLKGFVGIERDITNDKKLFDALLESEQSLRLFRKLVDQSSDSIEVLDPKTLRFLDMNEKGCKDLGYRREEILEMTPYDIDPVVTKQMVRGLLQELESKGSKVFETIHRRKDGSLFPVEINIRLVKLDSSYLVAAVRDVSERKKAEVRINEADILKNKFIQIVSHQFRTPLNAIRWNLDALADEQLGALTDAQREFAKLISKMDAEVIDRVGDLLTAMDIEEGRLVLDKVAIPLNELVAGVFGEMKERCKTKMITCNYRAPADDLVVSVDPEKIRLVIRKLFDNALDYTGKKKSISFAINRNGPMVRLSIIDTGMGIPAFEHARIFNRFFRASNAATVKPDASGLGLYIAKSFVEQHGGQIGFVSKEGKGSTFWFELPMKAPKRSEDV